MKNYFGIIRYFGSVFICFIILTLSFYNNFYNKSFSVETAAKNPVLDEKEEINQIKIEKEQKEETKKQEESKTVSNSKIYKGKIISRYISPYAAPSSYGKVYMKNISGKSVDIKPLLEAALVFDIKGKEPQVLIVHTHTTETYMKTESEVYTASDTPRTRNTKQNMVNIGKIVADELNAAGVSCVQATTEHDYPEYTGSYSRAAKTINAYLKKHPSIKVVIDLHRDAITSGKSDKVKLVTEINGQKAAQVMLVMGTGNEHYKENLKLAFKLQEKLEEKYKGLARPIYLTSKKYNQNLTKGSLLIEIGTDANTIKEAETSAKMVGKALALSLKK